MIQIIYNDVIADGQVTLTLAIIVFMMESCINIVHVDATQLYMLSFEYIILKSTCSCTECYYRYGQKENRNSEENAEHYASN